ncbi:MAG: iron-sulfur cluster carrier protein ApbC [Magnetovibrionaceae bacterium]
MAGVTQEAIMETLKSVLDEGADIVSKGMVAGLQVKDGHVALTLQVEPERGPQLEPLRKEAEDKIFALEGVLSATVVLTAEKPKSGGGAAPKPSGPAGGGAAPQAENLMPGVKSIVAVASGKGGVGKSTTTVNLALALAAAGKKVGVLDADIYGPSIPRMLGITGQPTSPDGKRLDPMENYGLKVMSMGFLVEEETPIIWRGPMAQSALQQMMKDINWGDLDVLVVDMPPGTGDIQLTLSQQVPLTGAVIVSTPQDIALLDARKGLNMFRQVDVPVFGLIENMSYYSCPNCGHRAEIFGHGGAKKEAVFLSMDFLGEIPLHIDIRETSDGGTPITISKPDGEHAKAYRAIGETVWKKVEVTLERKADAAPKIVFE